MEQVNKYANGKIYKLTNDINDLVYYGSTIKSLNHRLSQHTSDYKSYKQGNHRFITSFKLFDDNGTVNIELVENVNCNSRKELEQRERYYIENYECINKNVPTRTDKEWYDNNKDKIKEYTKEYREVNKNKIKEYRELNENKIKECSKKYREVNKEKIKKWFDNNKDKTIDYNKKYGEINRDKLKASKKEYYEHNKEKFKDYQKKKIICECGKEIAKCKLARHIKTKIHLKLTLELNIN